MGPINEAQLCAIPEKAQIEARQATLTTRGRILKGVTLVAFAALNIALVLTHGSDASLVEGNLGIATVWSLIDVPVRKERSFLFRVLNGPPSTPGPDLQALREQG